MGWQGVYHHDERVEGVRELELAFDLLADGQQQIQGVGVKEKRRVTIFLEVGTVHPVQFRCQLIELGLQDLHLLRLILLQLRDALRQSIDLLTVDFCLLVAAAEKTGNNEQDENSYFMHVQFEMRPRLANSPMEHPAVAFVKGIMSSLNAIPTMRLAVLPYLWSSAIRG